MNCQIRVSDLHRRWRTAHKKQPENPNPVFRLLFAVCLRLKRCSAALRHQFIKTRQMAALQIGAQQAQGAAHAALFGGGTVFARAVGTFH